MSGSTDREQVGRTPDDLAALLQRWYRQCAGLDGAMVTEFDKPDSGVVNETYLHTVTHILNGKEIAQQVVLRLQPATDDTPIPNVDVGEQAFVLEQLSRVQGLRTPRVLWSESDPQWLGRPFYLMERMRGSAVFDLGAVPEDAIMLRSMYQQAVAMLARIHAVDWRSAGLGPIYCLAGEKTALAAQVQAYRAHLDAASMGKQYPLLEKAFDWLHANLPAESSVVLNWGDARVGNLLYDGAELTAVLDWEIAAILPREVDVGWYTFFERFLRENGTQPKPGAMTDEEIVEYYEREAGVALADLGWYQRWAAFRLAVMRLRAGQYAMRQGAEPADSRVDEINFATLELARVFGYPEPL